MGVCRSPPSASEHMFRLGLNVTEAAAFVEDAEFVSLGCYCQVAEVLKALGLRQRSYPFDWTRSPLSGILGLIENGFEDFLTFAAVRHVTHSSAEGKPVWIKTRWGGSFFHHNPEDPDVRVAFTRRVARFLGRSNEVPSYKCRVFIRAVNNTRELTQAEQLHKMLQRMLPDSLVKLLLIVDLQEANELLSLSDDILVYRVHKAVYSDDVSYSFSAESCQENYARALVAAINFWTGVPGQCTPVRLLQLESICDQFDGQCPSIFTFWPRRIQRIDLSIDDISLPCEQLRRSANRHAKDSFDVESTSYAIDSLRNVERTFHVIDSTHSVDPDKIPAIRCALYAAMPSQNPTSTWL